MSLGLFLEYWDLLALSMIASLVAAPALAAAGALLHLRREAFLGVAVPQFATAGVAFALWLLPAFPSVQEAFLEHGHPPMLYLLPFAAGAAFLTLAAYGLRRGRGSGALMAGGFALAGALNIALLSRLPARAGFAETLLRGDILMMDQHNFAALIAVAALGLAFLLAMRRTLLVGAVDPDQAVALGLPLRRVQAALPVALGALIGCGVMTVGPVLVFALLFLPPLAAAALARNLRQYLALTLAAALAAIVLAWPVAIGLDLPYGAAAGVLAGALWALAALARALRRA